MSSLLRERAAPLFDAARPTRIERAAAGGRPLRIAMVCARYLPLMGGTEMHVHEVAGRLASLGHSITIVTLDGSGSLPPVEVAGGVRVIRLPDWLPQTDLGCAPGVYRTLVAGEWDLIHVQGCHTGVAPLAMLAALRRHVPFVLTFHSGGHSSALRRAMRAGQWRALAPLARRASHLIGVSQFEAGFFSEAMSIDRGRFTVVPNGAGLPDIGAVAEDRRLIISVGRLEKYKGHQRALAAMQKLVWRFPDLHLRILGAGPYEAALHALVHKLRLRDHVTIGAVAPGDRAAFASLLGKAALVVLFSEYEAHPVAVMEALHLRRKVLASDTTGFRELAEQGLISTIPLEASPIRTAEAMAEALVAPPPVVSVPLPGWDDCARSIEGIYRDVLRRAAAAP